MTTRALRVSNGLVRKLRVSGLALGLLACLGGGAFAGELPKEGAFEATFVYEGRSDAVQVGADQWSWAGFARIATVSESGDGLWHNMSGDCLGMGVGDQGSGYCRYSDSDGDMIFERWDEPVIGKGTLTALGGTGKFKGIEYAGDYDYVALPAPEGRQHLAGKKRGSYKLP